MLRASATEPPLHPARPRPRRQLRQPAATGPRAALRCRSLRAAGRWSSRAIGSLGTPPAISEGAHLVLEAPPSALGPDLPVDDAIPDPALWKGVIDHTERTA